MQIRKNKISHILFLIFTLGYMLFGLIIMGISFFYTLIGWGEFYWEASSIFYYLGILVCNGISAFFVDHEIVQKNKLNLLRERWVNGYILYLLGMAIIYFVLAFLI